MANLINESEIRATWSPIIESATGINDSNKLAWMSEYCHNHKLYEEANLSAIQPMMLKGMGNVSLPGDHMVGHPGPDSVGSGDKAPTLLPLAMQVAAQTVGLDLVPVVPMAGPMGLLSYLDFVYDGGAARNAAGAKNVYYVKVTDTDHTALETAATLGVIAADPALHAGYEYVGVSRIDGLNIWKSTSDLVAANLALDIALAASATATVGLDLELVKALEDHIPGFVAADVDGTPFTRGAGEQTPENIMGLSLFSKSVAAETFQVAAAVTREQVQDLKQFGVDAVAQVESVLTNELTQSINRLILNKMNGIAQSGLGAAAIDLSATGSIYGGETRGEAHRRVLTNILAAANLIANEGRRGAGNFAVVDWKLASALQAIAGFVPNPMANTFSQVAGAIYPLGAMAGINIYVDPNQSPTSAGVHSVLVGRKGDGNGSGLVFMPYLMAESVQTIAEGTMAPKIAVKSRFALVEAGFHPELNYQKFTVTGVEL
jgi:hypothetical protein